MGGKTLISIGSFAEAWQVAVDKRAYEAACDGSDEAKDQLRNELHGVQLYTHYLSMHKNEILIDFTELAKIGVLLDIMTHDNFIALSTKAGADGYPDLNVGHWNKPKHD